MESNLVVITKDDRNFVQLAGDAAAHREVAANYVIDSREMMEIATDQLRQIRDAEKTVETERLKIADPLYKAWKNTNALFKPVLDALADAKTQLGRKIVAFEDAERAKVRAAEMAAEARRQREIEAAEAALEQTRQDFEKGEASAEELEEKAIVAMTAEVATPISAVAAPTSRDGHARRDRYIVEEITDLPALLEWLAKRIRSGDDAFDNTVEIKLGQLNSFATKTKGTAPVPGVRIVKDSKIIARS